ncbi:MAG: hypothetical protein AMXMBFR13_49280 [Phycisphaerae bacterium]
MSPPETESAEGVSSPPDWTEIGEEIRCPLCGYNLRGLKAPRCPECGYSFTWPEVLDPRRRLHPYLFEHHPERNVWSFWKTARGAMRPLKFWTSLHPVQPSNLRRLVAYCLIGEAAYSAAFFAMIAAILISNNARRGAGSGLSFAGLVSEVLDVLTASGAQVIWLVVLGIPLLWPWATYAALRLFWISMRRAKVNRAHVLRCAIYSFDFNLWIGLLLLVVALLTATAVPFNGIDDPLVIGVPVYWAYAWIMGTVRLYVAYRSYLRFSHPLLTVLTCQFLVIFLAFDLWAFAVTHRD